MLVVIVVGFGMLTGRAGKASERQAGERGADEEGRWPLPGEVSDGPGQFADVSSMDGPRSMFETAGNFPDDVGRHRLVA